MRTVVGGRARWFLGCGVGLLALAVPAFEVTAEPGYPTRPIRLVIPFSSGGIADINARVVAAELGKGLGQQVYVENIPAGGGIPAAKAVLAAPADGYALSVFTGGTAASVSLLKNLSFDPVKDFTPVGNMVDFDFLIVGNASSPLRSLGDMIAAARAKPGTMNIGTTGAGSSSHLATELFKITSGLDITVVPFRRSSDLTVALMRNDLMAALDTYAASKGMIEDGSFRPVATTGRQRSPVTPDTQTVIEGGLAGYSVTSWNAIFAPTGTPPDVIARLNQELRNVLTRPDVIARLRGLGLEPQPNTPDEMGERLKADIVRWRDVIAKAKIEQQ